jgi:hypothetical protein
MRFEKTKNVTKNQTCWKQQQQRIHQNIFLNQRWWLRGKQKKDLTRWVYYIILCSFVRSDCCLVKLKSSSVHLISGSSTLEMCMCWVHDRLPWRAAKQSEIVLETFITLKTSNLVSLSMRVIHRVFKTQPRRESERDTQKNKRMRMKRRKNIYVFSLTKISAFSP